MTFQFVVNVYPVQPNQLKIFIENTKLPLFEYLIRLDHTLSLLQILCSFLTNVFIDFFFYIQFYLKWEQNQMKPKVKPIK